MSLNRRRGSLKNHELRRARRLVIVEGALGSLTGQLTAGILLIKFATELGATSREIALLQAVPQFVSGLQIFASWILNRSSNSRRLCLSLMVTQRLIWMTIGLTTLLWLKPGMKGPVWALILANGASTLCAQMALVAWYTWVADLTPVSFWGRFLGRRSMIALSFATPVGIAAGLFADWWFRTMPKGDLRGVGAMAVLGASLGLVGLLVLARVPQVSVPRPAEIPHFGRVLATALQDANFRRLALTRCWIMFFVQVAAPMWQFYALKNLGIDVFVMKLLEGMSNASTAAGSRFCGRLADRFGYRPVAILFCIGMGTIPVWWILAAPGHWTLSLFGLALLVPRYWIVALANTVGSFSWAGVNLCAANLALKLAAREHRSAYVALFQAAFGITGGLGALAGGIIVDQARKSLPPEHVAIAFQIVFLLSALGRWSGMVGLASVREPGAAPVARLAQSLARRKGEESGKTAGT